MIFSSLQYLVFLPIVLFLYWKVAKTQRLILIVAASYYFYMSWLPVYGILLFILTSINWILGLAIEKNRTGDSTQNSLSIFKQKDKLLLYSGLLLNLACLCYYKYADFAIKSIWQGLNWLSKTTYRHPLPDYVALNVILPLGISFFVFEFIHYLVDVYRGDKPVKSWLEFAAFAAFFPSQIAGPIKRFQDFCPRLKNPLPWSKPLFFSGMTLIVQGLFKKIALADPIGSLIVNSYLTTQPMSAGDAFIATLGFFLQVYLDFSGYTDIGRGSAMLMGIVLPENFKLPYLSLDIAEFWRRWHITLSFWFRDYVYIPLGGSLKSRLLTWRNLFITMVLCGLWHGAAWHYAAFGCTQGVGLIINREWRNLLDAYPQLNRLVNYWPFKVIACITNCTYFALSLITLRAPDMKHAINILISLFNFSLPCSLWTTVTKQGLLPVLIAYIGYWLVGEFLKTKFANQRLSVIRQTLYTPQVQFASWTAAAILILALRPTEATPFIYFQF
jgi:alginate O-acetyltransferase complex protein AlgI